MLLKEDIERLKRIEAETLTVDFDGYEPITAPFEAIFKQNKRRISPKDQQLLRQGLEDDGADRSNALFALGGRLLERGVPFDHAFILLQGSPVNKFEGRSDEVQRLYEGLKKVETKAKVRTLKVVKDGLPWQTDLEFKNASFPEPRYLVEGVWGDRSKGFIAAEPKCGKSTFAFDLALSIATGEPFLGHFKVHNPGRVFVIQEEMDPGDVQFRRRHIMKSKGREGGISTRVNPDGTIDLDQGDYANVEWLNQAHFKLDDEDHREALERKIKAERPVMVIFDPLQRMLRDADVRSERDMNEIFEWLDDLKMKYSTATVIVHHLKKPSENLGYDDQMRLLGSQALASWYESMLMLTRRDTLIRVRPTFRSSHNPPFTVRIDWGDPEDPVYGCEVEGLGAKTQAENLTELVKKQPGISLAEAAENLGITKQSVSNQAKRLKLRVKMVKPPKGHGGGRPTMVLYPAKRGT